MGHHADPRRRLEQILTAHEVEDRLVLFLRRDERSNGAIAELGAGGGDLIDEFGGPGVERVELETGGVEGPGHLDEVLFAAEHVGVGHGDGGDRRSCGGVPGGCGAHGCEAEDQHRAEGATPVSVTKSEIHPSSIGNITQI